MAKGIKIIAALSLILTAAFALCSRYFPGRVFLSLAITSGTVFYHFFMRLLVGHAINSLLHNQTDYRKKWFRPLAFEKKLYSFLKVKKWKRNMPSYDPSLFSAELHTPEEIVQAMCQAEIVHEVIILLSFLPLVFSLWFDSFWVFFVTSLLSACFDLLFVIMQRYNRPRLLRIIDRKKS